MNSSSDAAESVVRMSMQGIEVAARITGSGAKNIAALLYAILKDKQQTKGKTSLTSMLKTNKELKIFSLREDDLKKFTQEAKKYGVLYTALVSRKYKNKDGLVDIMVKAEDAAKINRIVERFNLACVDTASVISDIEKTRGAKNKDIQVDQQVKVNNDKDNKPIQKEGNEISNPSLAKTEKSPLSEHSLNNKKTSLDEGTKKDIKPSVREKLNKIKEEQKNQSILEQSKEDKNKTKNKQTIHQQPKTNKRKKYKEGR